MDSHFSSKRHLSVNGRLLPSLTPSPSAAEIKDFKDMKQLRNFEDEKSPTTEADSYPKMTSTRLVCSQTDIACFYII